MAEDNIWDPNQKPTPPSNPKPEENDPANGIRPNGNLAIVGYNLLALVAYTVFCAIIKDAGPFLDAVLLAIHVLVCLITGIATRKWAWALSALVVLLIGVSTCVGVLWKINGGL